MTRPTTTGKAQDLITFTRSTTGTYLDSVIYGDELVTNGTFDNNVDGWTVNADGTIAYSNGTAILTNTDGVYRVRANQAIVTEVGKTYVLTYSATGNYNFLHIGSEHFNIGIGQDGPHSKTFVAVSNNTNIQIGLSTTAVGVSSAFDNISVKELTGGQGTQGTSLLRTSAIDEARIEYDASGNCLGLLVEEARTNRATYSQDFTHGSWNRSDIAVGAAPVAAPDGTMTANHVVKTGSNGHLSKNSIGNTSDRVSVWARTVSGTGTMYMGYQSVSHEVTVTEEWQRFDAQLNNVNAYVANFRGAATLTEVYLWGAQVEVGTFPTSYIPTSGSTVTRAKDVASLAVSEFGYNQDQGTIVVERRFLSNDVNANSGTDLWEDGSNKISLRKGIWLINVDGSNQATSTYGSPIDYVSFHKIGLAFKPNSVIGSTSGGLSAEDTSALIPDAVNTIQLNRVDTNASFHINGHIKSIQYYPLRLSNAQLQALTV